MDGVFRFRQQFLEYLPPVHLNRGVYKDKQTFCEVPYVSENEQLTLVVDNSDGIFVVPTGGLSSSGAPCLFDWDIWVDYG